MKKNVLKFILFVISFFVFSNTILAYEGILQLVEKKGDLSSELTCKYTYMYGKSSVKFRLTEEQKKLFSYDYKGKNLVVNAYETFNNGCPTHIEFTTIKEDFQLSSGKIVDAIVVSVPENVTGQKYNNYEKGETSCGSGLITSIPTAIPKVISMLYTVIQIAVPIVLVIMGMLDLMKSLTTQKADEIKKGQQMLIKRLISGVLVFLVFVVVKFVISLVADSSSNNIMNCVDCFISNECVENMLLEDASNVIGESINEIFEN